MGTPRFLDPSSIPLKRQSGGNIWATLIQVVQGVTALVLLAGLMLFFLPVIHRTHELQDEKANLQRRISAEQDQQQELQMEIQHMKNDSSYVEHIARDRLNMGRPGETIIRFDPYRPEPATANPAHPTATAAPDDPGAD